jgi:hypothetical protein
MRFRGPQALNDRLEKSLRLCLAGLKIRRFDPIAEASELPDHSRGALLLGLFGDGGAPSLSLWSIRRILLSRKLRGMVMFGS